MKPGDTAERKISDMKKFISFILILCFILSLTACGGKTIGKISGPENECITIGDVKYIMSTDHSLSVADKGAYLGKAENSKITMRVYSVKNDANGDYIYVLWDWEGAFYKKEAE